MSICEKIFCKRRFPENERIIESAYNLKEKYDKKLKGLTALANKDNKLHEEIQKCVRLYDKIVWHDPKFSEYLLTSQAYNLKREKALAKINPATVETVENMLKSIEDSEKLFSKYKFSTSKVFKITIECRKICDQIKAKLKVLTPLSDNPDKHFRSLIKSC